MIVLCCRSVVLLALCLSASAAEEPTRTIAMILWRGETDAERGFTGLLAERGLPVRYRVFDCKRNEEQARQAIAAINAERPDLVYTFSTTPTLFAAGQQGGGAAGTVIDPAIPLVFTVVGDPVGVGLVRALTGHGRNLTGVSHLVPLSSQLPVLRATASFRTLGYVHDARAESSSLLRRDLEAMGAEKGFSLQVEAVDTSGPLDVQLTRLDAAVARLTQAHPDAVYIPSDSFVIPHAGRITAPLTAAGIPTFAATEEAVRAGGALLGVVGRYQAVGRYAGIKALRILRDGVSAQDIPIDPLPRYSVVLNLDTAHRLGTYPSLDILALAEVTKRDR